MLFTRCEVLALYILVLAYCHWEAILLGVSTVIFSLATRLCTQCINGLERNSPGSVQFTSDLAFRKASMSYA